MDAAYDATQWSDFAIAVAGATAALAGLLVVAISINLREILAGAHLPARAGAALIIVIAPLVIAVFVLIPVQSNTVLGIELIAFGATVGGLLTYFNWPRDLGPQRRVSQWLVGSALPVVLVVIPTILAGIGLLATAVGGLYWLPVATVAAILGGLLQAWTLLVEILR